MLNGTMDIMQSFDAIQHKNHKKIWLNFHININVEWPQGASCSHVQENIMEDLETFV